MVLPEYGRNVQNMVDYALTISDREERQHCAETIVKVMERMYPVISEMPDASSVLWNHLARISRYQLDIDYPVKIEREDVDFVMQMAKDSKMTGLTGEWSMKVKKVFSRGAQLLSEKIKKGQDVRIQIISKIDDPDAYGSERLVIENAWFNELTLQKFENAKMIDEEYSGGFTDYYFPDLVKVR